MNKLADKPIILSCRMCHVHLDVKRIDVFDDNRIDTNDVNVIHFDANCKTHNLGEIRGPYSRVLVPRLADELFQYVPFRIRRENCEIPRTSV